MSDRIVIAPFTLFKHKCIVSGFKVHDLLEAYSSQSRCTGDIPVTKVSEKMGFLAQSRSWSTVWAPRQFTLWLLWKDIHIQRDQRFLLGKLIWRIILVDQRYRKFENVWKLTLVGQNTSLTPIPDDCLLKWHLKLSGAACEAE